MTITIYARTDVQEVLFDALALNNLEPDINKCKIN